MQGIICNRHVAAEYKHCLLEGNVYSIQGINVIPNDEKYQVVYYQYQLLFTAHTKIHEIIGDMEEIPFYKYNLIKFHDIARYMNNNTKLMVISLYL